MALDRRLIVRSLGEIPYETAQQAQRSFTDLRGPETADEIWLLSHPAVFTLGQAGLASHILDAGGIPVVKSDRGGQVTYHGPGQLVVYTLIDLRRHDLGVRALVSLLEKTVVDLLSCFGVQGVADPKAPGVYVNAAKIAALGLRIRRGCSYHGLSLNVTTDLSVFSRINPCGFQGLAVTRTADHGITESEVSLGESIARALASALGAHRIDVLNELPIPSDDREPI